MHRVGRTARNGASGTALLYLLQREADSYIDLLKVRRVVLTPKVDDDDEEDSDPTQAAEEKEETGEETKQTKQTTQLRPKLPNVSVLEEVYDLGMNDRAIMEKAQACYVSYIRGYKEHTCQFVFRVKDLPFAKLATGIGLLFFPRLPDLKKFRIKFTSPRPGSVFLKIILYI